MFFHPKAVSAPIGVMPVMPSGARPLIILTFQIRKLNQVIIFQSAEVSSLFPHSRCVNHQVILYREQETVL